MMCVDLDFAQLFRAHYDEIASYLRRRQVDSNTADEIAQVTFNEAWRTRSGFDPLRGTPRSWLFGIAVNLMRRHFRTERRRHAAYARAASRNAVPDEPFDELSISKLDARTLSGLVAPILAALPQGQFEVVTLHCWTSLTHAEIAASLGIPEGTVKRRLSEARETVRIRLAAYLLEPSDG